MEEPASDDARGLPGGLLKPVTVSQLWTSSLDSMGERDDKGMDWATRCRGTGAEF